MSPWPGAIALVCVAIVAITLVCLQWRLVRDARAWRRHKRIRGTADIGFVPSLMRRQAP